MAKKKATKKKPNLNDIYNKVAGRADTEGLKIGAAETKRVLACFFDVLDEEKGVDAFEFVTKGLRAAGKRK